MSDFWENCYLCEKPLTFRRGKREDNSNLRTDYNTCGKFEISFEAFKFFPTDLEEIKWVKERLQQLVKEKKSESFFRIDEELVKNIIKDLTNNT